MDLQLIEEAQKTRDCINGDCANGHEGTCLYDAGESYDHRKVRRLKPFQIAILKARQDECQGFEHGGDDWTSNGEDVNDEAPSGYDRRMQMQAEIDKLEKEIRQEAII